MTFHNSIFLQMVQRALSQNQEAGEGIADTNPTTDASAAWERVPPPPQLSDQPKSPHELNLDGMVLRTAMWLAAVIDNTHVSLEGLVACLVLGISLCCAFVGVCCWRWAGRRGCTRRKMKGGGNVRVHRMPQRISVEKRAKTA